MMIIKLILKKQIINKNVRKKNLCMIIDIFILKIYVY